MSDLTRVPFRPPGFKPTPRAEQDEFELAVQQLQIQGANLAAHATLEPAVRQTYARYIAQMSAELRTQAQLGTITWAQAARRANMMRNLILETMRGYSSPLGRARAQQLKRVGKSLNELIAQKSIKLYGEGVNFETLTAAQKNKVYAVVVESAGKDRADVTLNMKRLSIAGKGVLIITLAIAVYNIATAEDKVAATGKEVAVMTASVAGGMTAGALAGLVCGPGAPVCVGIGTFIGGTLAAMGVSMLW